VCFAQEPAIDLTKEMVDDVHLRFLQVTFDEVVARLASKLRIEKKVAAMHKEL
jgi:ABC-type phosphonate transport system ATPase subunit